MKKFLFILIALICIGTSVHAKEKTDIQSINTNNYSFNTTLISYNSINNIQILSNNMFGDLSTVRCGNAEIPAPIPRIVRTIVNIVKVATPIALIIMGMIDMLKAVTANDEKKLKESQMKFFKRLIPAVMVFLVITIVQFVFSFVASDDASIVNCVSCMIGSESDCIKNN